ncbi:MAG: hypothetical protein VX223_06030 [Myxococcota bacterium]|nr:hypothetical protein [Myxococcota bacterium]
MAKAQFPLLGVLCTLGNMKIIPPEPPDSKQFCSPFQCCAVTMLANYYPGIIACRLRSRRGSCACYLVIQSVLSAIAAFVDAMS